MSPVLHVPNNGQSSVLYRSISNKCYDNKAIADIRLRPRSCAAHWWVSLSICHGVKPVLLSVALCFILVYNCGLTVRNKRICYVMLLLRRQSYYVET